MALLKGSSWTEWPLVGERVDGSRELKPAQVVAPWALLKVGYSSQVEMADRAALTLACSVWAAATLVASVSAARTSARAARVELRFVCHSVTRVIKVDIADWRAASSAITSMSFGGGARVGTVRHDW